MIEKITSAILAVIIILVTVPGCDKASAPADAREAVSPFASFRDVPGVTEEEIAAIEALQKEHSSFVYGMTMSAEAFRQSDGEVGGYAALLCQWLTGLFGIPFKPVIHDWDALLAKLENGEAHFTGELTATEGRRQTNFMTSTIAERLWRSYQIAGGRSIAEIAKSRPPRLVFPHDFAMLDYIRGAVDYAFDPVFANDDAEAYRLIKIGAADAVLTMDVAEPHYDYYGDVVSETFYPLVFAPVSLTTRNPGLAPIIAVVQKALDNGGATYLVGLYSQGRRDYAKERFLQRLNAEELAYIQLQDTVKIAAESDSYPISFHSRSDGEFQGIAFDALREIELLTGLSFKVDNALGAGYSDLLDMVERGQAALITAMMRTRARESRFLLPETPLMTDRPVLISKSEFPDAQFHELSQVTVGLVRGAVHAELFKLWFPNNRSFREYDSLDSVFHALERGEVDMFMAMASYLLSVENYKELAGVKINVEFDAEFGLGFGINRDEAVLCSIVDKALAHINLKDISGYWTRKRYDYRVKVAEARLPWLVGATALSLAMISLALAMLYRRRQVRNLKEAKAKTREANERAQIIFDNAPFASCMFDKDGQMIHCNQEVVQMFGIPDREFFLNAFFTLLFPKYQPDGALSAEVAAENIRMVHDKGYYRFECLHQKLDGEPLPCEVTLVLVKYRGDDVITAHFRDLSEQKAMAQLAQLQAETEAANRAKSSFLAAMSHEIRTPMNAISGMAELLLRREIPQEAKAEAQEIKQAASNLISIINDILDFSKIEAGKMEIVPLKYILLSLVNDTVNIIRMRLAEKPIRFYTNIDGKIPYNLIGDEVRLRQILLNLLSNAVKYTDKGHISLSITEQKREGGQVWLEIIVADSGKGIKQEYLEKLFGSFVRVDSKNNRGIEGTGLGLAITRELCLAMNGTITVESEYGKGSEFKVVLPQGVSSEEPFAEVLEPEKKKILVYEGRAVYARSLCWSLENLGVPYVMVETLDKFSAALPREEWHYVFSGYGLYEKIKPLMARTDFPGGKKPPLALMVEWENEANITGVRFISLPILSLSIANMLNGNEDSRPYFNAQSSSLIRFTYPGARLLVVDDISSNLKVAEGLLAPYQAKLVSCLSGARAIDLVKQHEYDIVFMDHMMPEMDGLEATAAIRAWEEERNKTTPRPEAGAAARRARVPIIALTANAVSGMREMFLENGFDDFLAKPIDISKLDEILHRWIPREKMGVASGERESEAENMGISHFPQIPGLDIPRGISMTGGRIAPYRQALSAFVRDAQKRLPLLQNAPQAANLPGFVTQVHALKSAAASLGAAETSARAAELEAAGSAADFDFIRENLPLFAERLAELIGGIEAWESAAPEQDAPGGERDQAAVTRLWPELAAALKAENAGDIDRLLEELMRRTSDTRTKEALEKISDNVLLAEFDRAAEIVRSLL